MAIACKIKPCSEENKMNKIPKTLKILFVGNSFSVDTAQHLPEVALSMGVESLHFGVLYIGGCSTRRHYSNLIDNVKGYDYYESFGHNGEWSCTNGVSNVDAIKSDDWDIIALQHGTIDGSKNTELEYYDKLEPLVSEIRAIAPEKAKIVFNRHWVGEPWHTHPEIVSFGGDTERMYEIVSGIVKDHVVNIPQLDFATPVGTAIQNARTSRIESLNRDGYHLSLGTGRYIASLTFFASVTGADITNIEWAPEGVDEYEKAVAIESTVNALKTPYSVTKSIL